MKIKPINLVEGCADALSTSIRHQHFDSFPDLSAGNHETDESSLLLFGDNCLLHPCFCPALTACS